MAIFLLSNKPGLFFQNNRYINPKDVKVIRTFNDLDGHKEGLILSYYVGQQSRHDSQMEEEILHQAKRRGINFIDLIK